MAAHRKSDRRRVYLCAGGLRSSGVLPASGSGSADFVQDAVNCFFNSVNFSVEAFNGASHLSQTSMWAEALQARLVNRAVVPWPYMWRSISLAIISSVSIVSIESSHARYDAPLWLAFAVQKLPSSRAGNRR
jgi:hypothetical protein